MMALWFDSQYSHTTQHSTFTIYSKKWTFNSCMFVVVWKNQLLAIKINFCDMPMQAMHTIQLWLHAHGFRNMLGLLPQTRLMNMIQAYMDNMWNCGLTKRFMHNLIIRLSQDRGWRYIEG